MTDLAALGVRPGAPAMPGSSANVMEWLRWFCDNHQPPIPWGNFERAGRQYCTVGNGVRGDVSTNGQNGWLTMPTSHGQVAFNMHDEKGITCFVGIPPNAAA